MMRAYNNTDSITLIILFFNIIKIFNNFKIYEYLEFKNLQVTPT